MNQVLDRLSRLVTARPYATLAVLLVVTVVLAAGASLRGELSETEGFLPPDSAIAQAMDDIEERFGESGEVSIVSLVFRGEALTPTGLAQIDALTDRIVSEPGVRESLAPADAVVSPALLIQAALPTTLQTDPLESLSQAAIDGARSVPDIQAGLDAITGVDSDGTPVAIATIRLREADAERLQQAERRIHELAVDDDGPLRVRSVSPTVVEDEYQEATRTGTLPLIGIALLLIAALILLFLRSLSDLLLTLTGLVLALIWLVGVEGWLGPDGLALIGPPSGISAMIPIIVISLTVDYAIQAVSHYREQRTSDVPVLTAVRSGLRTVAIPLTLAAITTIVSFLVTLLSPIPAIRDFGVLAGLGVGMSLIVMLTLIPAGNVILDRRRESRGTLAPPRLVANALPGIGRVAEALGRSVSRRPAPYILAVLLVTIGLGFAATGIEARFSIRDVLPRGGSVLEDLDTLDSAVGGSTEMVNLIVRAESTETRTLLNLRDLRLAFEDEQRRPRAAVGPLHASYELLIRDWIEDSGEPGDRYDPELAALFHEASAGLQLDPARMQVFLDRLKEADPTVTQYVVEDPAGIDTMLVQFPVYALDPELTKRIQQDVDAIWHGDDDSIVATSRSIISTTVTDEITSRQTEAIITTIAVALAVLIVFFWVTLRQPALAFIAVGPIVLVLIWVLGTMALLDIPYTLTTSIVTALSIGIGVDYTIHVIHRYREEFSRSRNPEQAAIQTLANTGSALLGSALTTALGLGVLIFSPVLASAQFGVTAAITIVYALLVSTLLVPPAMTIWGAYQNMRLRSNLQRMWDDLDVALEDAAQPREPDGGST